jgi:hypothetical protein
MLASRHNSARVFAEHRHERRVHQPARDEFVNLHRDGDGERQRVHVRARPEQAGDHLLAHQPQHARGDVAQRDDRSAARDPARFCGGRGFGEQGVSHFREN